MRSIITAIFTLFLIQLICAQTGKVGIGTETPGSLLHLYTTENTKIGLSIDAQGVSASQHGYLELITLGNGTQKLGAPGNLGWHITGRGNAYLNNLQQNDLIFSYWDGMDWNQHFILDHLGNIGMGTDSATSKLEIAGDLELGVLPYLTIKAREDGGQFRLWSSYTPFKGAYILANAADRPDDGGSLYFTHGDYTAPAPSSKIYFRFADDSTVTNQTVITSAGKMGIGTTNPGSMLHLFSPANTSRGISIGAQGLSPNQQAYFELITKGNGDFLLGHPMNKGWHLTARGDSWGGVDERNDMLLSFWNGEAWKELMHWDALGKIGIGTASPAFPLHVETDSFARTGYFYNGHESESTTFGIYAGAFGTGSGDKFAGSFDAWDGTGENIGVRAAAANGNKNIAVYGSASGGTTNWAAHFDNGYVIVDERVGIGTTSPSFPLYATTSAFDRTAYFYNDRNTSNTTFGVWGGAFGAGSGDNYGGTFEAWNGTGTNIGVRAAANGSASNIGVYGTASGGTTNWAAHFDNGFVIVDDRIGIGTTTPDFPVHATTYALPRAGNFYNGMSSSATTYGISAFAYGAGTGDRIAGYFGAATGTGTNIGVYASATGGTNNWAAHFDNGYVIVDDRIGVGTTLPNFPIQVETSTLLRAAYVSNTMTTAGNVYGYYSIAGNDGTGGSRGGYFVANGTNGENNGVRAVANSGTTNIGVYSGASGGTTNWAAHFDYGYVIVDERVGIGTTSPVTELHVDGIVQIGTIERLSDLGINLMGCSVNFAPLDDNMWDLGTSSNRWDDVYATNGTIQTSDRRDKTNINNLSYGIREIMRLKPVTYRWKSGLDNRTKIGLIAQDVEAVIPEVVVTEDWVRAEDGTIQRKSTERLGMYYSDLIPVLIKGMQEQQQVINDLQSENRELREAMEDLAARVAKIEGRP